MTQAEIPQRASLVVQTAGILRRGLAAGRWVGVLPGERLLGRELQISRGTLRAALQLLVAERRLRVAAGRYRIAAPAAGTTRPAPARVGCLAPIALSRQPAFVVFWFDELRRRLHQRGMQLEYHEAPQCYGARGAGRLAALVRAHPGTCWILSVSTAPMQRWFGSQGVPAIVAGSLHEGIRLPSVDIDFRAVGRHAGGMLLGRGHRRLALLAPIRNFVQVQAGILEAEAGLREAMARRGGRELELTSVHHLNDREHVVQALDRLLQLPRPPTALLVAHPPAVFAATTYLAQRGLLIPRDLSLVSTQDEPYFDHMVPEVTHYEWDPVQIARGLDRLAARAAQGPLPPDTRVRLIPRFVAGRTLGRAGDEYGALNAECGTRSAGRGTDS